MIDVKGETQNWRTILFTLYNDKIIYKSIKSDNEEESAELAEKRMKQISVPTNKVELCKKQNLATKPTDSDNNYFFTYFLREV